MAIEMRKEEEMTGVTIKARDTNITRISNKKGQKDNVDDRLSIITDDSSTVTTEVTQIQVAREYTYNYEKGSGFKLHEGGIIKLGNTRRK